jgi:multiple sugar transport system permease protein
MKARNNRQERAEHWWGLFFITPWILGFLAFSLAPMVASLGFTFTNFNPANPDKMQFVGATQWLRAFFEDPETYPAILKTLLFSAICLPITFGSALAVALVLNSKRLLGKSLFQTLFFMPTMIPTIAAALIWTGILNPQTGWVNVFIEQLTGLHTVGPDGIPWTTSPQLIYFTYSLVSLWGMGNTMIIFLAGLQNISVELYEAADIDGAGWWMQLRRITLPLLSPVIFFNLTIALIGLLQYFAVPFTLNQGRGLGFPDGASNFLAVDFYAQTFAFANMGYGAVLAWVIFAMGLAFTLLLFWSQKKWVYYGGEK